MELPKDSYMLLSIINMKLRDDYPNLEELCRRMDIDMPMLKERFKEIGFKYDESVNQFR